jgi:hypothetical protein
MKNNVFTCSSREVVHIVHIVSVRMKTDGRHDHDNDNVPTIKSRSICIRFCMTTYVLDYLLWRPMMV